MARYSIMKLKEVQKEPLRVSFLGGLSVPGYVALYIKCTGVNGKGRSQTKCELKGK